MMQSDAGKYEVKIHSTNLDDDGGICDNNILPTLEKLAFYSSVTFILQESNLPTYDVEDAILDYALPEYQGPPNKTHVIDNVLTINFPAVFNNESTIFEHLYKDGVHITDTTSYHSTISYGNVTTQSLRITYNNTEDVTGRYYYVAQTDSLDINADICPDYVDYINIFFSFPIFTLHWNIKSYSELYYIDIYFIS